MQGPTEPKPAHTPPVLVTRPRLDALRWVEQLQQRGVAAEALPLIEVAAASAREPVRLAWQQLPNYAAVMFVSGNAVEHFFELNQALAQEKYGLLAINNVAKFNLTGLRAMAPGPGTAQALRAAGVPDGQIDAPPADAAQFDSQTLWQVVGGRPWQGKRALIVRGQSANPAASPASKAPVAVRDWLARQLESAGAQVDFVVVYERRAPRFSAAELARMEAARTDGSVWLFSSSEAISHLPPRPRADWSQSRAIATHPRIAAAARAAGWGVVIESRPALPDIVASIESMHS